MHRRNLRKPTDKKLVDKALKNEPKEPASNPMSTPLSQI